MQSKKGNHANGLIPIIFKWTSTGQLYVFSCFAFEDLIRLRQKSKKFKFYFDVNDQTDTSKT